MFSKKAMQHTRQAPGRDIHKHFSLAPARGHTMTASSKASASRKASAATHSEQTQAVKGRRGEGSGTQCMRTLPPLSARLCTAATASNKANASSKASATTHGEQTQTVKGRRGGGSSAQTYYAHILLPHLRPPVPHHGPYNSRGIDGEGQSTLRSCAPPVLTSNGTHDGK